MRKSYLRIISLLLTGILLANLLPLGVYAEDLQTVISSSADVQDLPDDTRVVGEVTENRTAYSKEFILSNGLHMAAVYPQPVHYQQEGNWLEIDNTLTLSGTGTDAAYTNTAGDWAVSFPRQLSADRGVSVTAQGHTLTFYMAGQILASNNGAAVASIGTEAAQFRVDKARNSTGLVRETEQAALRLEAEHPELIRAQNTSRLEYADVYENTHVVYDLVSNQLKESIVMEHYSETLRGYRYTLNTGTLIPVLLQSGAIELRDSAGKTVMTMPAPYLLDDAGSYCDEIQVDLQGSRGTFTLSYHLPLAWLADETRQWPVVLDPIISHESTYDNAQDQVIYENTAVSALANSLTCGYDTVWGRMRSYIQYHTLPPLGPSDVIVNASLRLCMFEENGPAAPVELRRVTQSWDAGAITWNSRPAVSDRVEDFVLCDRPDRNYTWDITDMVRSWYDGDNYGMMLQIREDYEDTAETNGYSNWQRFFSSNANVGSPSLVITIRSNNGLESYWDYTASSAGRAGTGYINNYTGNLVWVRGDLGFGGNRMPVSISHVYNSNDSTKDEFGMGYGWRTNFNQRVYEWSGNNSQSANQKEYYVWEDSDGTAHYFYKYEGNTYKDEDGLNLTLKVETNAYTITDQTGNVFGFDAQGLLIYQENNQETNSRVSVAYEPNSNRISTVTDGAGRVYAFDYNDANLLREIRYKGTGDTVITSVTFSYNGKKLTKITDADTKYTCYGYGDKNLLISAEDVDDYRLVYTYAHPTVAWKPSRVIRVAEFDNQAEGGSLDISYGHNQTAFTDANRNTQILQFNDWGNTVSIQDGLGRAQYARYATDQSESAKGNQLKVASKLQNTVSNLAKYSSFETGSDWNTTNTAIDMAISNSAAYLGSKSLRLTRSSSDGSAAGLYGSGFTAAPGQTYTFSAYVKTGNASAYLRLYGDSISKESTTLAANSDWTRLEVSYTNTTAAAQTLYPQLLTKQAGTVFMDCVQIEQAPTASRYNLMENGDFRYATHWQQGSDAIARTTFSGTPAAPQLDNTVYQTNGSSTSTNRIMQAVYVSGSADDCYVLGGWAKGDSVPTGTPADGAVNSQVREFSLIASFVDANHNVVNSNTIRFNPDTVSTDNWQYAAGPIVAAGDYAYIQVELAYDYNVNTAIFDGIQLFKEYFGTNYIYDDNGNLTTMENLQSQKTHYQYNKNHDLIKVTLPEDQGVIDYTYDAYHNVLTSSTTVELPDTTTATVTNTYTYDTYGNNTSTTVTDGTSTTTSSAEYTPNGNALISTTDAAGNVTRYDYDPNTNVLNWVQYPRDTQATRTNYTYDNMYRLTNAAAATNTGLNLSAEYTYEQDQLKSIETHSTTYNFAYGDFGLRSSIRVGNSEKPLATYRYTAKNNYLERLVYGNEDVVNYTYDTYGRLLTETYEDGTVVSYAYDNTGALASVTDSATGQTRKYYYDFLDRPVKYTEEGGTGLNSHAVLYTYDKINNLAQRQETVNGETWATSYTYDQDNRLTDITTASSKRLYTYDGFSRVTQKKTNHAGVTVLNSYLSYRTVNSNTTSQVSVLNNVSRNGNYSARYAYTYDNNGNITAVTVLYKDGTSHTTTYLYDSANQLIRENNQAAGKTWTWSYDAGGNLRSKREFAYNTGTLGTPDSVQGYAYTNTNWGDLVMTHAGKAITYDGVGNMLTYGDRTFTWKHGRQLETLKDGTNPAWAFTYDDAGMRLKRTNGTIAYTYVYDGGQLSYMSRGSETLRFTYDGSGTPVSVTFTNSEGTNTYYYVTNLQGDVTALLKPDGTAVVEYTYDAWGKPADPTGTLAGTLGVSNPLRYRGYVYDIETGLYYLQSRYYDPQLGRFISLDKYLSTGQGFLGNNIYVYCLNNPINDIDPNGTCSHRWDFWNDCEECGGKNINDKWKETSSKVKEYFEKDNNSLRKKTPNSMSPKIISPTKEQLEFVFDVVDAAGDIATESLSSPEKMSQTLDGIVIVFDVAAGYCGLIAAGLAIPSCGISVATAGTLAAIFLAASIPFRIGSYVIDILEEDD